MMMSTYIARWLLRFGRDRRGVTVVVFALSLPVLFLASSAAIEYANLLMLKTRLQKAVDTGAVSGAKALTLVNSTDAVVSQTAQSVVASTLSSYGSFNPSALTVDASIQDKRHAVAVRAVQAAAGLMGRFLTLPSQTISAQATATLFGQSRLCVLVLDPVAPSALQLQNTAQMTASQCSVYADSGSPTAISATIGTSVTAGSICSVGGYVGVGASLSPTPLTDCPLLADPLLSRSVATPSTCDYSNKVVSSGTATLNPGVYCNGLTVTGGAIVTLSPGIYTFDKGPLNVAGGATLQGTGVGLFLRSQQATLQFAQNSTINLTAPTSGDMAGLLVFEDRTAPIGRQHKITSDNARQLLGTIYMSRGTLVVDAAKPVADQSAYTVIVARALIIKSSANLVMNAMYADTNVPVPEGLGPNGSKVALSQ